MMSWLCKRLPAPLSPRLTGGGSMDNTSQDMGKKKMSWHRRSSSGQKNLLFEERMKLRQVEKRALQRRSKDDDDKGFLDRAYENDSAFDAHIDSA